MHRYFTTSGRSFFYDRLCRHLLLDDDTKKESIEKIFHAVFKHNCVLQPPKSDIDSSSGEFVYMYSRDEGLKLRNNLIILMNSKYIIV